MKIAYQALTICCCLIVIATNTMAAQLMPLGPVDVTGMVSEITWVSERKEKGIPYATGSLGGDRTWPAHFRVKLIGYEGVTAETAIRMTSMIEWKALEGLKQKDRSSFALVNISHNDGEFIKKGIRIKISGYSIRGDEGGTWTSYNKFEILD